ncbi:MAG: AEC family transporter [Gammaproteobacteria bacterium]|nr:AEC family transporter [Gammaproteobacteria bacterium]
MLVQVFNIVAPLFIIIAVGYFYGARVRPEMRITNQLVMDVFMPVLIFHVMVQEGFSPLEYSSLVIAGCLLMLGSGLIAFLLAKVLGYGPRALIPSAMFSNWANLGLPLYILALGQEALDGGIMLVVAGNILCFTIGIKIYSGHASSWQVLKTPIIIAVIAGGLFKALNVTLPVAVDTPLQMMGQVAIPLMLFSLGVRLTRLGLQDIKVGVMMAVFCPVIGVSLAFVLMFFIPLSPLHKSILILFGALPPAVINYMLAEQYDCEPDRVASMVIIANLAAIVSLPLALLLVL